MSKLIPHFLNINIGSNSSWLQSVWLGSVVNLWWFPDTFLATVGGPIMDIAKGLVRLIFGLSAWVFSRFLLLAFGLVGKVRIVPLEDVIEQDANQV